MKIIAPLIFWLVAIPAFAQQICLSEEEMKLYDLIMQYRKSKKLKKIPISAALTKTAQAHVRDLADNYVYDPENNQCNPHSWSDKGTWTPCCYTSDHREAACMWNKPKEIAGFTGYGYEIAYWSSAGATAQEGLNGWKKSPGHNPLLINLGQWQKVEWKSIGIGFYKEYGVVWFSDVEDRESAKVCK
ncbi:MAG TPA: CAP domain-containing protein [Cyclobacteriaceae bacterium]